MKILRLRSSESLPIKIASHYIQLLDSANLKINQLHKLVELIAQGVPDQDIWISKNSPSWDHVDALNIGADNKLVLADKGIDPRDFWEKFSRLERPIIFQKMGDVFRPIYNPFIETSPKIILRIRTPIDLGIDLDSLQTWAVILAPAIAWASKELRAWRADRREQELHVATLQEKRGSAISRIHQDKMTQPLPSLYYQIPELLHNEPEYQKILVSISASLSPEFAFRAKKLLDDTISSVIDGTLRSRLHDSSYEDSVD